MDYGAKKPIDSSLKTGEILMHEGLVCKQDIDDALGFLEKKRVEQHGKFPGMIGNALCELNRITPLDLYRALYDNDKLLSVRGIMARTEDAGEDCGGSGSRTAWQDRYGHAFALYSNFNYAEKVEFDVKVADQLTGMVDFTSDNRIMPVALSEDTLLVAFYTPESMLSLLKLNDRYRYLRVTGIIVSEYDFNRQFGLGLPSFPVEAVVGECKVSAGTKRRDHCCLRIMIWDPLSQKVMIRILYHRYLDLKKSKELRPDEEALFHEFIGFNFNMICQKYRCSEVEFFVDENTASIQASPGAAGMILGLRMK